MPLSQPQRIKLAQLLGHLRPDWHDAGIHSSVVAVADKRDEAASICAHACIAAGIASNRTPECINFDSQIPQRWTSKAEVIAAVSTPLAQDQPCPEHGDSLRRRDGEYHCCWLEQFPEPEPLVRHSSRTDADRAETRRQLEAAMTGQAAAAKGER